MSLRTFAETRDALFTSWITTLNSTADYRILVNGFVNSLEYRSRFGQP